MNADPEGEDSRWLIVEDGFSAAAANTYETLFTTGNGYLGTRGSLEEGHEGALPGTFLRGVFDHHDSAVTDLVQAPDWHSAGLGATVCNSGQRICRMVSPLPQPVSAVYTMAFKRRPSARHSRSASDRLLPDVQVTAACSASSTLTGSR